jgi:hypothetical protein
MVIFTFETALVFKKVYLRKTAPMERFMLISLCLFLLRDSQEAVAWVFLNDAVFWKVDWLALGVLLYLSEEVDCLRLAAAKGDFGLVQVVCDALRVCVLVSHWFLYLLLVLTRVSVRLEVAPVNTYTLL